MGSISTFLVIHIVVEIVISMLALSLNGIFIIALVRKKTLHSPSNAALGCLCCSDLLIGILGCCMSILLAFLVFGTLPDEVHTYISVFEVRSLFAGLSSMFVTLVNIDRYAAICHPFKYLEYATPKLYAFIAIAGCIFTILEACACIVLDRFYKNNSTNVISTINFIIITCVLLYCNLSIVKVTQRHSREIASIDRQDHVQQSRYQGEIKRYYIVGLLVIIFVLCKLPIITALFLPIVTSFETTTSFRYLILVSNNICLVDSLLNPLVYYFRLQIFRNAVKDVFCSQRQL